MEYERIVLLDRDGTIIREQQYLSDPDGVVLLPGASDGIRMLKAAGFRVVVVTNQSGVSRGYFTTQKVEEVNQRMLDLLALEKAQLHGIYVFPHHPKYRCECRKPRTALALQAAVDCGGDLTRSFVVGDKASDLMLAKNVGAQGYSPKKTL